MVTRLLLDLRSPFTQSQNLLASLTLAGALAVVQPTVLLHSLGCMWPCISHACSLTGSWLSRFCYNAGAGSGGLRKS